MKNFMLCTLLCSGALFGACCDTTRMGKKDRDDLMRLVAEPMKKIEQKIDSINQAANHIQNFIVDNYNQPADSEIKHQYHELLSKITHISLLLEALVYVIQAQTQYIQELNNHIGDLEYAVASLEVEVANLQATIGSPSDVSVGEEDFNSVEDIDAAQLSLVSWSKTEYREQLHDKFIS